MIEPMDINDLKRRFQALLDLGITQEAIADQSGVPVTSLRKFKSDGGKMGEGYCMKLEKWILESGLNRPTTDICFLLAKELRMLADVMESDASLALKADRWDSLIHAYEKSFAVGSGKELAKKNC